MALAAGGYARRDVEVVLTGQYASYCRPKAVSSQRWFCQRLYGHLRLGESYGQVTESVLKVSFYSGTDFRFFQGMSLFDRCAAFGINYNDRALFQTAGRSFAVKDVEETVRALLSLT